MARKNLIRRAIENFAEYRGCTVRKWGSAYAIHDEAGMPLARLRPHPEGGFEIDYWSRQRRWKTVKAYPKFTLPLDEALEFTTEIRYRFS